MTTELRLYCRRNFPWNGGTGTLYGGVVRSPVTVPAGAGVSSRIGYLGEFD